MGRENQGQDVSLFEKDKMLRLFPDEKGSSGELSHVVREDHETVMVKEPEEQTWDSGQVIQMHILQDDYRYECVTHILRKQDGSPPVIVLQKPDRKEMKRVQLRSFFRVPVDMECIIRDIEDDPVHIPVNLFDLSGGGCAFYYNVNEQPETIREGDTLRARLSIPDEDRTTEWKAQIVRMIPEKRKPGLYKVALEYSQIQEVHREAIIRFCFQRQLELRRI